MDASGASNSAAALKLLPPGNSDADAECAAGISDADVDVPQAFRNACVTSASASEMPAAHLHPRPRCLRRISSASEMTKSLRAAAELLAPLASTRGF